jgi:hypothetical protein
VALVLVGACAALAACSDDSSSTVAGEVVAGRPSLEIIGDFGFVLIPTGRIDVVVGEAQTGDVTPDEARDDATHQAPEGGSWIPVHIAHDPFGHMGISVGLTGGSPQPAQVALVVDGKTTNLGAPYRVVGDEGTADSGLDNVWVAVDERPDQIDSVRVAVTYDGLTQTVNPKTGAREAGAAEPLYVKQAQEYQAPCAQGGIETGGVELELACTIGPAQRTPYLPGAGWAAEDHAWLVLGAAVSVSRATADATAYDVVSMQPALTVDGSTPLPPDGRFGEVRRDPQRVSGTWAFDVAAEGAVSVGVEVDLRLRKSDDADPGPGTRRATVRQTVELAGELAGESG